MPARKSRKPIADYGALVSNFIIALSKCGAAIITGSSAMLSEGIHSLVDTGDQLLLLWGTHQSRKPADTMHPFGHFLAYESKGLLLGERADSSTLRSISRLVHSDPAVVRMRQPLTMHFGPDQVLLNLDILFRHDLSAAELAAAVDRLEQAIQREQPQIKQIFLEAESLIKPGSEDGQQV